MSNPTPEQKNQLSQLAETNGLLLLYYLKLKDQMHDLRSKSSPWGYASQSNSRGLTKGNSKKEGKRDIFTFNYSISVMSNHAGLTFTRPIRAFTYKHSTKLRQGEGCLEYLGPYNWNFNIDSGFNTAFKTWPIK